MDAGWSDAIHLEPVPIPAGDRRVLLNGSPSPVPCRVLSEDEYQLLLAGFLAASGKMAPTLQARRELFADHDVMDPEGLERWRRLADETPGHDLVQINATSVRRIVDLAYRAMTMLARARAEAREEAAAIAENFTREGRDWVPGSLWDNITKGIAAAIRGTGDYRTIHAAKGPVPEVE